MKNGKLRKRVKRDKLCSVIPHYSGCIFNSSFVFMRYLCIHGHFYQPPRENPWLDATEVQDSAAPHHDWNARITAECYWPNAAAHRLGADNRITGIANNYASINFNFGPTLTAWLARHEPELLTHLIEADRISR